MKARRQVLQALKPEKLKRYKDVVALLIKYGRSDLVKQAGLDSSAAERESIAVREQEPEAPQGRADHALRQGRTLARAGC